MILQRAAAGSGKTFKLAKTYIRLMLAYRSEPGEPYILLPPKALRESHSRILAVTFTNKATNEMKERIVSKLAQLAQPHPLPGQEPEGWVAPDYLLDFTGENPNLSPDDDIIYTAAGSPATRAEIAEAAGCALRALLNDYGHFNISTIDTFFQSILRTFAYELRLNDNYHVELNDDYLAQVGTDRTLSMVNRIADNDADANEEEMSRYVNTWARETISDRLTRGENWNMFRKSTFSGIYSDLLDLAKKMNKESFKLNAAMLDDYFSDISRFDRFYAGCRNAAKTVVTAYNRAMASFKKLHTVVAGFNGGADPSACFTSVGGSFKYIRNLRPFSAIDPSKLGTRLLHYYCETPGEFIPKDCFIKKEYPWRDDPAVTDLFRHLGRDLFLWQRERDYWTTILSRLHYLGLLHYIRLNTGQFRTDNNLIPLSATNEILLRIIGNCEVPFIYERIGTRLDHYLLDEFQDTSTMQWRNLLPLLQQSTTTGQECLIIGDAKQSIYRFRNAEPDIINNQVTAEIPETRVFPSPSASAGSRAEVNANYRSAPEVITANNTIFSLLPLMFGRHADYLKALYSGAIQNVKRPDLKGYVSISLAEPLGAGLIPSVDGEKIITPDAYNGLPYLIDDLRRRGFRLADIAILVNRNAEGSKAIEAIMNHNARMHNADPSYKPIEVLSEESLKVGDSAAVKVILAVLAAIARGFRNDDAPPTPTTNGDTPEPRSRQIRQYELAQFVANFHCYFAAHPDEPLDSILKKDLDAMLPPAQVQQMLREATATTLPALIENIAAQFTSTLGAEQAPYIAALQDAVLEYCENYPPDIASFLAWWEENGKKCSIAAPEGIDAVRVMTIHKSKGLEFNAVLIPSADWSLLPTKNDADRELIWVNHRPPLADVAPDDFPGIMPVTPALHMADPDSPFHREYSEFERNVAVDQLNKTYVAFTRAKLELHVYAPAPKSKKAAKLKVGSFLADLFPAIGTLTPSPLLLTPDAYDEALNSLTVGSPVELTREPGQAASDSAQDSGDIVIDLYSRPSARRPRLLTLPDETP